MTRLALAPLVLTGCLFGSDSPPDTPILGVALGAEVHLSFGAGICGDGCLAETPEILESASFESDGVFELRDARLTYDAIAVTVRADAIGDATLRIAYTDTFGDRRVDRIRLRSAAITHTTLWVPCGDTRPDARQLPVPVSEQFAVTAEAFADELPLRSGDLELIEDTGGFTTISTSGNGRVVVAPAQPGVYTWILTGPRSEPYEVWTYDPAALAVRIAPPPSPGAEQREVVVEGTVDGVSACIYRPDARARVETSGACRPVVGNFEVVGGLPVSLVGGPVQIELAGQGTCTVTATLPNGATASLDRDIDNAFVPPGATGAGSPLGPDVVELAPVIPPGDACMPPATDGECTGGLSDGDCIIDSDWAVEHHDGTGATNSELAADDAVGIGLSTELRVHVLASFAGVAGIYREPPDGLTIGVSPSAGLNLTELGCRADDEHDAIVRVDATAAGTYSLTMNAWNIDDVGSFSIRAEPVARAVFSTADEQAPGPIAYYFPQSTTSLHVAYQNSAGASLRGAAPVLVTSSDAAAGATVTGDGQLFTGASVHDITVASSLVPQTKTIGVRDAQMIDSVGGLSLPPLATGAGECLFPYPVHNGAPIYGDSPVRPEVTITGAAFVIAPDPYPGDALCIRPVEAGSGSIEVRWGSGLTQLPLAAQ